MNTRHAMIVKTPRKTTRNTCDILREDLVLALKGIPQFPEFKPLELSDREEIIKHTSKFVPYSDFNFTSLWSWDTDKKLKVSNLNQNLVVQFSDYISDEQFLSFIGTNEVNETMSHLLALAEIKGLLSTVKLVPSVVVEKLDTSRFIVEEDRNNFDYIYSVQGLTELKGSLFADIRNQK
ncbi:MAG: hypothetical protein O3A36_01745, partial [bacterium]|nr:hypothetical protein [bacterium]